MLVRLVKIPLDILVHIAYRFDRALLECVENLKVY